MNKALYRVKTTSKFRKDYKRAIRQKLDIGLLDSVIELLAKGEKLPGSYKDHLLSGIYEGFRECHIKPDWLLIYRIEDDVLTLTLIRTGSHSNLF